MYVGRVEKLLAHYSQIPLCFVNLNGKITRASSKIAEVFKYDGIIGRDIFELTRISAGGIDRGSTKRNKSVPGQQ